MSEMLNGYALTTPFTTANSGSARWCFGEKHGQDYFIKEFLSPVYPEKEAPGGNSERVQKIRAYCEQFEKKKRSLYLALRDAANGNIVIIEDFFRLKGRYYSVAQRIPEASTAISAEDVSRLSPEKKVIILKILAHSLMRLEERNIVHADLKPTNILLKETKAGFYTLKLIDFDASFFADDVPEDPEALQGDMVYLAPEMFMAMCGETVKLDCKVDVFAAGVIFHQFLCGSLPEFDRERYQYAYAAVLDGAPVRIHPDIPDPYPALIRRMLARAPEERPTFAEVFAILTGTKISDFKEKPVPPPPPPPPETTDSVNRNPYLKPAGNL